MAVEAGVSDYQARLDAERWTLWDHVRYRFGRVVAWLANRVYRRCPCCKGEGSHLVLWTPGAWVTACPLTEREEAWARELAERMV